MFTVMVPQWIRVVKRGETLITDRLMFFMVVFNQDVRPLKIEDKKKTSRIVLGVFRGVEPTVVGYISFPLKINRMLSCIQVEPLQQNGRMYTLLKGYVVFMEPVPFSGKPQGLTAQNQFNAH